jgi:ATP-dependent phosphofructokinase / diphosphate-dependent phosphofructokinase
MDETRRERIGILVGGGPAPGINAVIHSVTIEAVNRGHEVIGICEGFQHLMEGELEAVPLTIADVSRVYSSGGSILGTSRANPTTSPDALRKCATALREAGITCLVGIGGDDTAFSLYKVASYAQTEMGFALRSVHVPKTIDNDLPLPEGIPTFGYETAREVGTRLVNTLLLDALTSGRHWFLVVTMGRRAGHLALGIGRSSGATLTVIPEEWRDRPIRLQEVVDILATAIILRRTEGKNHGVAVIAEGIVEHLTGDDLKAVGLGQRDEHGHLWLADVNFGEALKRMLSRDLEALGVQVKLVDKELGYELRCADPIAYDVDYTRSLGEAAVDFLLSGGSNATISLQHNQAMPMPFEEMIDGDTGRIRVRMVNIDSFTYRSAHKFMIRLKPKHAQDGALERMAKQTNLPIEGFRARYGYLVGLAPRPF